MTDRVIAPRRDEATFARLLDAIRPGARLAALTPLPGGVSGVITAIDVANLDASHERLVVWQHGRAGASDGAMREFRLLQLLAESGYPAPVPVFVDSTRTFFPAPVVAARYIDGAPDLTLSLVPDGVQQMADALARLHTIDLARHRLDFLPAVRETLHRRLFAAPAEPDASPDERRVREATNRAWPAVPARASVILHGDFWPGNLLWHDSRLAGVIDWEDAAIGDPLFDLAAARLELHWARDGDAVDALTRRYLAQTGMTEPVDLPFWDLSAALDPILNLHTWGHPPDTEAMMRRKLIGFVNDAIERLLRMDLPAIP